MSPAPAKKSPRRLVDKPLRPPGAQAEKAFQALCIKCGRCTLSCPYKAIIPAPRSAGLAFGTPQIFPRSMPCYLCMICPPTCPTGALRQLSKERVDMGEARIDESRCYAFKGILCRACVDACPFPGKALVQDLLLRPKVDDAHCVGCGICVKVCPTKPTSIRVEPRS